MKGYRLRSGQYNKYVHIFDDMQHLSHPQQTFSSFAHSLSHKAQEQFLKNQKVRRNCVVNTL